MPVVPPRNAVRAAPLPPPNQAHGGPLRRVLIVGCGALGKELVALTRDVPGVDVTCLPAELHNRPEMIAEAVASRIRTRGGTYERVFVAYADCGTGGALDRVLATEFDGVERIPGAHCYEFYSGAKAFATIQDEEPGTFYLTDFLARQFDRIVWQGLGLDRHPELLPVYFGNYRRLVYLAQTDDADLVARARAAASRLGLAFEVRETGLGNLATALVGSVGLDAGVSVTRRLGDGTSARADQMSHPVPLPPARASRIDDKRRPLGRSARLDPAERADLALTPAAPSPSRARHA